jgi:hypothetical protein
MKNEDDDHVDEGKKEMQVKQSKENEDRLRHDRYLSVEVQKRRENVARVMLAVHDKRRM